MSKIPRKVGSRMNGERVNMTRKRKFLTTYPQKHLNILNVFQQNIKPNKL